METHNQFDTFQSAYRTHHSCARLRLFAYKTTSWSRWTLINMLSLCFWISVLLLTLLIIIYSWTNFTRSVYVRMLTAGLKHSCLHEHNCGDWLVDFENRPSTLWCATRQHAPTGSLYYILPWSCRCIPWPFSTLSHVYNDTQLYVEFPNGPLEHSTSDAERMSRCITDVKTWLTQHTLAMDDKKTEAIMITTVSTAIHSPQLYTLVLSQCNPNHMSATSALYWTILWP